MARLPEMKSVEPVEVRVAVVVPPPLETPVPPREAEPQFITPDPARSAAVLLPLALWRVRLVVTVSVAGELTFRMWLKALVLSKAIEFTGLAGVAQTVITYA